MTVYAVIITALVGLIAAWYITPLIIAQAKERGILYPDMNKFHKPKVTTMGGIGVLIGFICAILAFLLLHAYLKVVPNLLIGQLLAATLTILTLGIIGITDDLIGWKQGGIKQWQHALLPVFAAIPLMTLAVIQTNVNVPIMGPIELGILYSLIIVPIGITGAANATNMLAGFNGLETGLGIITATAILIIALAFGRIETVIVMAALLGALIAFLKYNWYPAQSFAGNTLTLIIGGSIAAAVIIGNMEKVGLLLFPLFFIEFVIKAKHRFKSHCFGIPQKNGTLLPDPKGGSLTHIVMRLGHFTEKQVVLIILGIQTVIAVSVVLIYLLPIRF